MAAKKSEGRDENLAPRAERETVSLKRPTLVTGRVQDGDVEVYDWQRRHLVDGGYVDGGVEDIASPAEIAVGALEVLKKPEDRDIDVWSVDKVYEENNQYETPDDAGTGAADADEEQQS